MFPRTASGPVAPIVRRPANRHPIEGEVATPADWKKGEEVIIVPAVKDDEAKKLFPKGWNAIKPYLRKVPDPSK